MSRNDETRARRRDERIDEILAVRSASGGNGVGIFGADVCALCGEVDTFRGFIMAMYGIHWGPEREFVCGDCRRAIVPRGETCMSVMGRLIRDALRESQVRYCRLCRGEIRRHPQWGEKRGGDPIARLCGECRQRQSEVGVSEPEEIQKMLRLRRRRRYLELLDDDELANIASTVATMKKELDDQAREAG